MNALEEARSAIRRLSVPERQIVLEEFATQSVEVAPGIFRTPGVCGGDACIRRMRIPVWLLQEGRENGATDAQFLDAYPQLTITDLQNAWAYVDANKDEIEALIKDNQSV